MVEQGSHWTTADGRTFTVINRVEAGGKAWVYYRCNETSFETEPTEYSCYEESFLERFTQHNN